MELKTMNMIKKTIVGGIAALALSTSAQAAFITYGTSGTNTSFLAARSDILDLGGLFSSFTVESTLGLSFTSATTATLTAVGEELQVVQGCAKAAALCTPGEWFDITGKGLSLGGSTLTKTATPITDTFDFSTALGGVTVTGVPVQSLRLSFASDIAPPSSLGLTGSLSVTAVPEPTSWALLMSGLLLTGFIVRRRLK